MRRRPPLPDDLHPAWWSFVDCAEVIERGRRQLLVTLAAGRIDPASVIARLDTIAAAVERARGGIDTWGVGELSVVWKECVNALEQAEAAIPPARSVAASTGELERLLGVVAEVVEPLDAFADAERAWRRRWRLPAHRPA